MKMNLYPAVSTNYLGGYVIIPIVVQSGGTA